MSVVESPATGRPPNAPWRELMWADPVIGYVSIFLADDLSPLPVRGVTRLRNNKSDPNLETGTYGLFSTCSEQMRRGVVKNRARYVFFVCNRGDGRELVGYYQVRWYAPDPGAKRAHDYCLAADEQQFIFPGIPVQGLPAQSRTIMASRFRMTRKLDATLCQSLIQAIKRRPDQTTSYLSEIDRLERFQMSRTGFRYVGWRQKEPFSWELAAKYLLKPRTGSTAGSIKNQSPTDRWLCQACQRESRNKALLKRCPWCGEIGTLIAVTGA